MLGGTRVRRGRGLERELADIIRPLGLRADALFRHGFDPIANLGTSVRGDGVLGRPFVVVNEEARGNEVGKTLFEAVEFDGGSNGIGGAGSEVALVVDGGTFGAEVDLGGQGA